MNYTLPYLTLDQGNEMAEVLQARLHCLNELHLTLKHVHWNVAGPGFIAVHEMLDPQVDEVRLMVDAVAERMATLGAAPIGTPRAMVASNGGADYALAKGSVEAHLAALDAAYSAAIRGHHAAAVATEELDPVTNGMLLAHLETLEQYQWFIRAHLEV